MSVQHWLMHCDACNCLHAVFALNSGCMVGFCTKAESRWHLHCHPPLWHMLSLWTQNGWPLTARIRSPKPGRSPQCHEGRGWPTMGCEHAANVNGITHCGQACAGLVCMAESWHAHPCILAGAAMDSRLCSAVHTATSECILLGVE